MAKTFVLDAHTLIWMLEGNPKLGARARIILSDPVARLVLPAIALAEVCAIVAKGRTSIPDTDLVLRSVRNDLRILVEPLTSRIVERTQTFPVVLEMHDGQIVATALSLQDAGDEVVLLTKDADIVASGLVTTLW